MNIKSLLLGSAAALVAVSGARAADAVVIAEPEPMEYVRVCDTYGAGFFYIPGTETCLKFDGYFRYDIGVGSLGHEDVIDKKDLSDGDFDLNDTYYKRMRAALRWDARSETELGTLRGYAHINFDYDTVNLGGISAIGGTAAKINHAWIELGGFKIGKSDSVFSSWTDYSSGVSNDGLVPYGPFDTHFIQYTFTGGNGFAATVALEEGGGSGGFLVDDYTIDSYIPHVVAGASYTQGWGKIGAVVGYDSVWEEFAVKGRIDVNATEQLSLFVMAAYDSADNDGPFVADYLNYYAPWGGDWAAWVGGAFKVNEKATINAEIGYDDFEDFSVAANVAYELVPGLTVSPEVVYTDNFDSDEDGDFGGFLRIQRNF